MVKTVSLISEQTGMSISAECLVFLKALCLGAVIAICYCIIVGFRKSVNHKKILISLEDFSFCVVTTFFLFSLALKTTCGEIRWYILVGAVLGAYIFCIFMGKFTIFFAKSIFFPIGYILKTVKKLVIALKIK